MFIVLHSVTLLTLCVAPMLMCRLIREGMRNKEKDKEKRKNGFFENRQLDTK